MTMTTDELAERRMKTAAANSRKAARQDIFNALNTMGTWISLAWWDTRMRYQRTLLGPLWITISTGVFVFSLGLLYSKIFKSEVNEYLPYLAAGFMVWNLMAMSVMEAPGILASAGSVINSMRIPYTAHIIRNIARHTIVFLHTLIVILIVDIYVKIPLTWSMLLSIPGIALLLLNVFWMSLLLSLIGARYRDIGPVLASIFQLMFFLTPIIWQRSAVGMETTSIWVEGNPFYHLVDVVRSPMLGKTPSMLTYAVTLSLAFIGHFVAYFFFLKYRRRVSYWV